MRISRDLLKIQRPNGSGGNLLRSTGNKIYLDFLSPFGRTIISYLPLVERLFREPLGEQELHFS